MKDSVLAYCPRCGSNAIEVESQLGANCCCVACRWTGLKSQLVIQRVEGVDPEALLRNFVQELRNYLVSPGGMAIFLLMKKYGFFSEDAETMLKEIRVYAPAVAQAIGTAILEKRRDLHVGK